MKLCVKSLPWGVSKKDVRRRILPPVGRPRSSVVSPVPKLLKGERVKKKRAKFAIEEPNSPSKGVRPEIIAGEFTDFTMWRRLLFSPLKSLKSLPSSSTPASAPLGCISKATRFGAASHVSPSPDVSLFARHYASDSADTGLKKKVEDVMPIATGEEREELEASLEGKDILDINHPVGPFGTKQGMAMLVEGRVSNLGSASKLEYKVHEEAPAVIKSYYDERLVGCPGGEGEDEHDVVWFRLRKGVPHECPVCSQYFVLEVVGPGGSPDGYGDDDHHH
ncbi:unnamed protein product [Citrullus colocynthis]|uniref:Cytochrome c oxidase subunit Vb n=1 Tax=Citrullus colocynthis TaxID=252529 RepID=A0ABP0YZX8_9ROSI